MISGIHDNVSDRFESTTYSPKPSLVALMSDSSSSMVNLVRVPFRSLTRWKKCRGRKFISTPLGQRNSLPMNKERYFSYSSDNEVNLRLSGGFVIWLVPGGSIGLW